jgi:hypothetical protein
MRSGFCVLPLKSRRSEERDLRYPYRRLPSQVTRGRMMSFLMR